VVQKAVTDFNPLVIVFVLFLLACLLDFQASLNWYYICKLQVSNNFMCKYLFVIFCVLSQQLSAQTTDTLQQTAKVIVYKDDRIDILGDKEAEINASATKVLSRSAWGYRLQVLSTNDREYAMKTKTMLLQRFPGQKTYMLYQMPYLKLRFGNFKTKQEATLYKNQISRMLDGASVYLVQERIEVKPEKEPKEEDTD
jgi:hypothetical protein